MNIKSIIKLRKIKLFLHIPFNTLSVGSYIRGLYLKKCVDKLPVLKFKNVLDAGCGDGYYSKWLAKKYPSMKIYAYDIQPSGLWKNKPDNLLFKKENLSKFYEQDIYDFCYCIDVLNCISKNKIALNNICRSLKRGGYLYLHIPCRKQKRILFKKYFKKYDLIFSKKFSGELYSQEELNKIITYLGLNIVKIYRTFGLFGKIAWEINTLTDKENKIFLKILLSPLLKLLSFLECRFYNNDGNGISILAKKSLK